MNATSSEHTDWGRDMADNDKKNMVKARLLVLTDMFNEKTDEHHWMDTFEIIDYLAENGVPANTKTLRSDLALLKEHGMDIITIPGRPNKYYCGARLFDIAELKLLIDAVNSSRFITSGKSRELNRKLLSTVSEYQRKGLKRSIYTADKIKPKNKNIFYMVDTINDAIQAKRKISFQIAEYDGNKKRTLRNNGEVYTVSPYAMYWNDDFYYAVGWSDKRDKIQAYRVDRMVDPTILEDKAVKKPRDFRITDYSHKVFEMFDGEEVRVKLECRNELMKYVIDRFGESVETEPAGDETFICYADVRLSPTFYGGVFGFKGGIKILEPTAATKDMIEMAKAVIDAK